MTTPIVYDPAFDWAPGSPGLLYDSGYTDTITIPAGVNTLFGTAVGVNPATSRSALPVANPLGVALKDMLFSGRRLGQVGYIPDDAISVLRRGRVWVLASGTCTRFAVAKYDPATGIFGDAGSATMPGAKFFLADVVIPGILPNMPARRIAVVELHDPTA